LGAAAVLRIGVAAAAALAGGAFAAVPGLGARGWNSKPILPPGVFTR